MPNTSSAKKAHRSSLNKRKYNKLKNYKIKVALKELRKEMGNDGKNVQEKLSKVFSALDKAVKTDYIPKGRADRKKSRLANMVAKHNGKGKTETVDVKTEEKKSVEKKATKKTTATKKTVKQTTAKSKTTKKTTAKTKSSKK